MPQLSKRTDTFTDSVIRRMTRISLQYGAVNLSQGFPDFDPPRAILDRLAEVANEDFHQYSITWGAQNFREALAAKQSHFMGCSIDPDCEIVVTCGSTEAMMAAMMTEGSWPDQALFLLRRGNLPMYLKNSCFRSRFRLPPEDQRRRLTPAYMNLRLYRPPLLQG